MKFYLSKNRARLTHNGKEYIITPTINRQELGEPLAGYTFEDISDLVAFPRSAINSELTDKNAKLQMDNLMKEVIEKIND